MPFKELNVFTTVFDSLICMFIVVLRENETISLKIAPSSDSSFSLCLSCSDRKKEFPKISYHNSEKCGNLKYQQGTFIIYILFRKHYNF